VKIFDIPACLFGIFLDWKSRSDLIIKFCIKNDNCVIPVGLPAAGRETIPTGTVK